MGREASDRSPKGLQRQAGAMAATGDRSQQSSIKGLTETLASIETQYQSVMETTSDAIVTIDADLRIVRT